MTVENCEWLTGAFKPCDELRRVANESDFVRIVTYYTTGDEPIIFIGVSFIGRQIPFCPFCGVSVDAPAVRQLDEAVLAAGGSRGATETTNGT